MKVYRIACIIGTRPEIIKMSPIIHLLKTNPAYQVCVINTAQHRGLLDDMLALFAIKPDIDFDVMQSNQSLSLLSSRLFAKFDQALDGFDMVLVQGDTTTGLVAAQVAFYKNIAVGHVEAGLRSHNFRHPFPEEMNRVFISKLATLHFTPTEQEAELLRHEGIATTGIYVTGNPVIDSLLQFTKKNTPLPADLITDKKIILVTMHRRESFGNAIRQVFRAFVRLTELFPEIEIIYPIHPNPHVRQAADDELINCDRIKLIEPLPYHQFVMLMKSSYLILSDSGGIQEEAPALNIPLLILRNVTERPLVVSGGMAKLIGTDADKIVQIAAEILANPANYHAMQKGYSPYGDGHAANKIVTAIDTYLTVNHRGYDRER